MPTLIDIQNRLAKRDYYSSNWTGGARWAFFAIFLVVIALCVIGTLRVNKNRSRQGAQPIYGTRWMTPPSYFQSQGQYNQPTRRDPDMPNAYVPTYTATANADDMGYYAPDGTYHANPNAKGPAFPENAHQRTTSNSDGHPLQTFDQAGARVVADEDLDFTRPTGPPPSSSAVNRSNTTGSELESERPDHPPPPSSSTANRNNTTGSGSAFERPNHPPPSTH
ncbi:hypothetical protein JCM33374_g1609 [Metschnikowia sp. JCM 33374]|nr:hypothetical protein JCM33374_g1609 [Metschnikowia sp. JCM 33374]